MTLILKSTKICTEIPIDFINDNISPWLTVLELNSEIDLSNYVDSSSLTYITEFIFHFKGDVPKFRLRNVKTIEDITTDQWVITFLNMIIKPRSIIDSVEIPIHLINLIVSCTYMQITELYNICVMCLGIYLRDRLVTHTQIISKLFIK